MASEAINAPLGGGGIALGIVMLTGGSALVTLAAGVGVLLQRK